MCAQMLCVYNTHSVSILICGLVPRLVRGGGGGKRWGEVRGGEG